ncbi:MAG TPA: glycosyltransferase family 39 protein [Gemmatimonadaceae bacterium]
MNGAPRERAPWRAAALAVAIGVASTLMLPTTRTVVVGTVGTTLTLGVVLACLVVAAFRRAAVRAAGWLALALVGWTAALQLVDAPPAVAYQHLDPWSTELPTRLALAICLVQLVLLALMGRGHVRAVASWLAGRPRRVALVVATLVAIGVSAMPSRDPLPFIAELTTAVLLQVLAVLTLVAAARSLPTAEWSAAEQWTGRALEPAHGGTKPRLDRGILFLAAFVTLVAASLAWFAYQAHPHVPDEVIYLLQARYLADGQLTMPLPPVPAGFNVDLMYYEPARWFSPVPPGWPMALALGAWLGTPWLVNPVLGGIAVLLTYVLLAELQPLRTARLATILLACSPWFLFMSMNFMTHTLSLVCALGAALAVARARRSGRWPAALVGGLLAGAVSLVRPLEGLVVAALLGLWSLGARGRAFRLLPSVAFVAGTVGVGALVGPYNAMLTGSPSVFPIMAYVDKYYVPGSNEMGFGPNRGLGWPGLDPFPGHGPVDVVVNTVLNAAQTNVELLGWPFGSVALLAIGVVVAWRSLRREDAWMAMAIAGVAGAHAFYWFSGGPDFGARYWYLAIVPACALLARVIEGVDQEIGGATAPARARAAALVLSAATLFVFVPWRAAGKYYHYRGMRPDVRTLAGERGFGRSLVLVRGRRHPDYASAAIYNPIDLRADAPLYAWDAAPDIRTRLLAAYPDRSVWILDGPSLTGGGYRVAAGPLTPSEAARTIPPDAAGDAHVYDPVSPPRPVP